MTSSMDLMHKQKHPSLGSEKIKDDCWIFLLIVKSAVNNVCVCICVWGGYVCHERDQDLGAPWYNNEL